MENQFNQSSNPHTDPSSSSVAGLHLQELKIAENANKAARYCQEETSIRYEEDLDQPKVVSLVDTYNVKAVSLDDVDILYICICLQPGGRALKGDRGPMGPRVGQCVQ